MGLDAKVYDAHIENNGHLWCNLSVGLWSAEQVCTMDRKRWGLEAKVYETYCENSGHLWCNLSVDWFENHEQKFASFS